MPPFHLRSLRHCRGKTTILSLPHFSSRRPPVAFPEARSSFGAIHSSSFVFFFYSHPSPSHLSEPLRTQLFPSPISAFHFNAASDSLTQIWCCRLNNECWNQTDNSKQGGRLCSHASCNSTRAAVLSDFSTQLLSTEFILDYNNFCRLCSFLMFFGKKKNKTKHLHFRITGFKFNELQE